MENQSLNQLSNLSRTMRAGRKLAGLTQSEAAKDLGISQSCISKLENGIFFPDADLWYRACDHYQINSEEAFRYGVIDRCQVSDVILSKDSKLKANRKYLRFPGSKVRAIVPFIKYFEKTIGPEKLNLYLREKGFDPDYFSVLDLNLNLKFLLDLLSDMKRTGVLSPKEMHVLIYSLNRPEIHGFLFSEYRKAETQSELLSRLVSNSKFYETNFSYSLLPSTGKLELLIEPNEHLSELNLRRLENSSFLCHYKKQYFQFFSNLGKIGGGSQIIEKDCFFKGDRRCVYEINLQAS